jgi:ABC-type multidrug transport system ATPase subunit
MPVGAVLIYIDDAGRQCEKPVAGSVVLGRHTPGGGADVAFEAKLVSRTHGDVFEYDGDYYYRDLGSKNGSYINNHMPRLEPMSPYKLSPGDVIQLGSIGTQGCANLTFALRAAPFSAPVSVPSFAPPSAPVSAPPFVPPSASQTKSKLTVSIAERSVQKAFKKIVLLKEVRFAVEQGEMVMILGGSGAGKTTLMNAIMGYERAIGQIRFGDKDVYKDYGIMKYRIGYVPQQDLLREKDSVYDTLSNAAKMKMPASTGEGERRRRVLEVLKLLGLQREITPLVSKLSGGQRKRLSIAVEYIANPSLFFLDEPDSGLDGVMARSLTEQLRQIADTGKIVMVITHSPDRAPELYNKIVVLAKSASENIGRLAYFGSVSGAYAFFETDSLEGVVKRINRPDEGGDGKSDFFIKKYMQMGKQDG